ncbi:MAG TPA: multidrug efflux RND transporter permease subunit [Geminicoccaceae bacterium]|nr:multidrug efflux RND transporter permease subunit [Geminicoccaceae bacterium]
MKFFIARPIFASAIALIIVLAGGVSMLTLPIAQFPPLVPPQVNVSAQYIGASAEVVENSVTIPIEEQLNGAEGMIYMASNSTNNGNSIITVTFDADYDQDIAQMELLSRTNQALSQLPPEVQQVGVSVQKSSSSLLLAVNLVSPNGTYDERFLQNYAEIHVLDPLARIPGVAQVVDFGLSEYAMRIWLDPDKLANLGMTATDVVDAIGQQNQQAAAGALGLPPAPAGQAFTYQLNTLGRLEQVEQFEDIVIRALPNGSVVRIKDVGRVELGADDYSWSTTSNNQPTGNLGVFQLADANGLEIAKEVEATMRRLEQHFPEDLEWTIIYDTTMFVRASITEVIKTMLQAVGLVLLVIFIFLQNWRSTLIPTIAVPVSLIGAFAAMAAFGFTINTLSLLGLVVAVALVVDDAIVVVENVNRRLDEGGKDLTEIAELAMTDVRGPIIATTLVLMAVFVPVAFIPGLTGQLYNQFALTIAIAVGLSGFNSLTLSPALCATLLRPTSGGRRNVLFRAFNAGFAKLTDSYVASIRICARFWYLMLLAFAALCALAAYLFLSIPQGFVPDEDQGYVMTLINLPDAATISRTEDIVTQVNEASLGTPGVSATVAVAGYNIVDAIQQPNAGIVFVVLKPWDERSTPETSATGILAALQKKYDQIEGASVIAANAPPIMGLSATGGFNFELQDLNDAGIPALAAATRNLVEQASRRPELANVYTTFNPDVPQRYINLDRVKAMTRGVSIDDIFNTLQINLGSLYVNQFNKYGRVYRVYVQAERDARADEADVGRLQVRNKDGQMIYLNAFIDVEPTVGPYSIQHYDMYRSAEINGSPAPGYSSGQAVQAMEELAATVLPAGFGYQWTDVVYQQKQAGNLAPLIFALSMVVVFLVLAALYESWVMPVIILLAIPLGLLGAVGALTLRGLDLDVYGQIGLVMLIGLVAKNSILIVEFARDERRRGAGILEAATTAARIRLRPILMTALAFVIGLLPLVFATGAGANARRSLGTMVVGGLFLATVLIVMVPIFYYVIERLRERRVAAPAKSGVARQPAE